MSSVDSPLTSPLAEHGAALSRALSEVGEHSFFAYVEACDAPRFAEAAAGLASWIRSSVTFRGAFDGMLSLTVPDPLGRELFGAFTGAEPGVVAADTALFDLTGELANMVCGAWLTQACRGRFDLGHPEALRVAAGRSRPDTRDCLLFLVNDQPAYLRLTLPADGSR